MSLWRLESLTVAGLPQFFNDCAAERPDVVILRLPGVDADALYPVLARSCHTIAADTLLEFRKTLRESTIADKLGSGTEIVEIGAANTALLDGLVERCYHEYRNHYFSNPALDTTHVLNGLVEFSRGFMSRDNRTVFVALRQGMPCGYLCMEISADVGSSVIGGSALDIPHALRHKVLCDLTHHGDHWLMQRGIRKFRAVTRTDKIYIQKLLIHNMHCMPAASLATLHMNLFLDKATAAPESPRHDEQISARFGATHYPLRDASGPTSRRTFSFARDGLKYLYHADYDALGILGVSSEICSDRR